jgi:hypothetical protein
MPIGSSDLVRQVVAEKYVRPAIQVGKTRFSVAVREIMKDLQGSGFPVGNYPQICTAMRTGKFLKEQGLEIEKIDGPPKGLSPTVVVHYKLAGAPGTIHSSGPNGANRNSSTAEAVVAPAETPQERAFRLTQGLCGLLKEELAEYGGGEAFIQWIRSDDGGPPPTRSSPGKVE